MQDTTQNQPLVLIILDGWGERADLKNNGIEQAKKPFFDLLKQTYPHTAIDASGHSVGLPDRIMGNSEVGHMNLGAGRIVYSGLSQIYKAIEDGSFFTNPAYLHAMQQARISGSTLHLMGLLSDGAVHSHQDHLYALLKMAKQQDVQNVAIHCFLDGRDTPPTSGIDYIKKLEAKIAGIGVGQIASISGRYYAMDRDKRWDRVEKAFQAITGQSTNTTQDYKKYIQDSYDRGVEDEFIAPASVLDAALKPTVIKAQDACIFFNFRADRAIELALAFTKTEFNEFDRQNQSLPAAFVCTSIYDKSIEAPVAFVPNYPTRVLGEILAEHHVPQLRLAETEKYAHVTYFFNGGRDVVFDQEDRILIPSPRDVSTYDLKPEMSAYKIKNELLVRLISKKYGAVIMNFANGDMVGHTAKPEAIFKAIEVIDECLSEIVPRILSLGGVVIITADHGNAEEMVDSQGRPLTAHTTNLVPFIVVSDKLKNIHLKSGGRLCDVAPTMLAILGLPQPPEMTGVSLIVS